MKKLKTSGGLATLGLLLSGLGTISLHAVPVGSLPDVSPLIPFAVFGNDVNLHNVTVNGNVGVSANGTFALESPSTVNGNVYLASGVTTGGGGFPGNINGTLFNNQDLAAAQARVATASATLAALTPNLTLASISSGQIFGAINGVADVYVVNVTGDINLGSGENISFVGDAGDFFVLNVAGDVDMGGNAAIGSLPQASHIFFNLTMAGSLGNVAHVDNIINATTIIPNATYAEFHSINGAIWGANGEIKLMSGSKVQGVPLDVPDAGSTLTLMGLGLGLLAAAKRKLLS
jgi:hypothetical protein